MTAADLTPNVLADLAPSDRLPPLPFDHDRIAVRAIPRLRDKSTYSSLPAFLLPREFTLHEPHALCKRITGGRTDKANLRRQIVSVQKLVELTGTKLTSLSELFRLTETSSKDFGKVVV